MILAVLAVIPGWSRADRNVYIDSLDSGWENWSWDTTISFSAATPVHSAPASMSAQYNQPWAGVYLHSTTGAIAAAGVTMLRFWAHGGSAGGQTITIAVYDAPGNMAGSVSRTLTAGTWTLHEIPLSELGSPSAIDGLVWQEGEGSAQAVYYLDDIVLVETTGPTPTPPPPGTGPAITVDVATSRHAISPYIYGINFADESLAAELDLPVRRYGGNATSRYNWQIDSANRGSDWFFENIPEDNGNVAGLPDGSSSDLFVEQDRRTGTASIITIPMIGWTPRDREYRGGFSVAKYGAQTEVDPWRPDLGNGILASNGLPITGNDPADTSVAIGAQFVRDWIAHLQGRYGTAAAGGVRFYNLDNEPELWSSTHRDVRPQRLGYDELRDLTYTYAAAVKAQDPAAQTLGPVSWGWTAYFYSDLDAAPGGAWWTNPLDRNAHGGVELTAWYLQQMQLYETTHGVRILDYLDLHYYPQAPNVTLSGAGNSATQALRLRSTRSLWDPGYTDESWIDEPVRLIPRMRDWVNAHYPGTKLAMTEYNWGALDHINGAVAQADVLGIFGREKLDLATLWAGPDADDPGAFSFRLYRNYDGAGSRFGDVSVSASSADQGLIAAYAAERTADGALTIMMVNKATEELTTNVTVVNHPSGAVAEVWRYSAGNLGEIVRLADAAVSPAGLITATYPAQSVTLLVVPAGVPSGLTGDTWIIGGE